LRKFRQLLGASPHTSTGELPLDPAGGLPSFRPAHCPPLEKVLRARAHGNIREIIVTVSDGIGVRSTARFRVKDVVSVPGFAFGYKLTVRDRRDWKPSRLSVLIHDVRDARPINDKLEAFFCDRRRMNVFLTFKFAHLSSLCYFVRHREGRKHHPWLASTSVHFVGIDNVYFVRHREGRKHHPWLASTSVHFVGIDNVYFFHFTDHLK